MPSPRVKAASVEVAAVVDLEADLAAALAAALEAVGVAEEVVVALAVAVVAEEEEEGEAPVEVDVDVVASEVKERKFACLGQQLEANV